MALELELGQIQNFVQALEPSEVRALPVEGNSTLVVLPAGAEVEGWGQWR